MQYSVNDKVMHPKYGPGHVIQVQHRELVPGFEHYYVIELLDKASKLYVPVRKADAVGIRPVMSRAKLARVIDTLHDEPHRLVKDFKARQEGIREKLSTAQPVKIAEAVRDLAFRRYDDRLTKVDQDLLDRARDMLAAEMAAATDSEIMEANETIQAAVRLAIVNESSSSEESETAPKSEALLRKLLKRMRRLSASGVAQEQTSQVSKAAHYVS